MQGQRAQLDLVAAGQRHATGRGRLHGAALALHAQHRDDLPVDRKLAEPELGPAGDRGLAIDQAAERRGGIEVAIASLRPAAARSSSSRTGPDAEQAGQAGPEDDSGHDGGHRRGRAGQRGPDRHGPAAGAGLERVPAADDGRRRAARPPPRPARPPTAGPRPGAPAAGPPARPSPRAPAARRPAGPGRRRARPVRRAARRGPGRTGGPARPGPAATAPPPRPRPGRSRPARPTRPGMAAASAAWPRVAPRAWMAEISGADRLSSCARAWPTSTSKASAATAAKMARAIDLRPDRLLDLGLEQREVPDAEGQAGLRVVVAARACRSSRRGQPGQAVLERRDPGRPVAQAHADPGELVGAEQPPGGGRRQDAAVHLVGLVGRGPAGCPRWRSPGRRAARPSWWRTSAGLIL